MALLRIGILMLFSLNAFSAAPVFNITSFGAIADGKTNNAVAIQKAIDKAGEGDGATVVIPTGVFLTGPIFLRSGVNLHLDSGAVLLGSANRFDYGKGYATPLINADQQQNLSITGKGIIDGNGKKLIADIYKLIKKGLLKDATWQVYNPWHQKKIEEPNRPKMLFFTRCKNILVKNVKFKDGTDWIQDYKFCENLVIDSITVESNIYWNNDGIDIVDCKNVKITNSFVNVDDDGICLKSESRQGYCDQIYIANCRVRSSASAIKLGTASAGGFKNITIRDIEVYDTFRSAIALEAVDGGFLENIDIKNINAVNTGNAIFIRLGHRNKDTVMSRVDGIHISNVRATIPGTKPDKGYPMEGPITWAPRHLLPIVIAGLAGHQVKNVTLERVRVSYTDRFNNKIPYLTADSLSAVPENASEYPEFTMFGPLPAWGLYARHVEGLTIKDVDLNVAKPDKRAALVFDDVNQLTLSNINLSTATYWPAIIVKDVKKFDKADIKFALNDPKNFLYVNAQKP